MGSDININDTENNKENAMSIWHTIKDKNDVGLSDDGKTIEIAFMEDYNGANYVDVPIEFIKEILQANPLDALVSHVCGEQELKKKILNKFIDRVTYYEKQKLTLPRSEKLKSRIRELKYMMKEIDNIFFENDSRKSG